MSGHSKWSQIKHKKASTDQKRGALFSKLLNTISIAARDGIDPDFNPTLRSAIEKAKSVNVPMDKIQRAIRRVSEDGALEEVLVEVYGLQGVGIIIRAVTNNKNRTIAELKKILNDHDAQIVSPGGVRWSFDPPTPEIHEWRAKFPQGVSEEIEQKINELVQSLEDIEGVAGVYTTIQQ